MRLFKQAPMFLALMIVVWSMTIFRRSGTNLGVYRALAGFGECEQGGQAGVGLGGRIGHAGIDSSGIGRSRMLLGRAQTADWAGETLTMTIFCSPKSYTNESDDGQRRALLSWLALKPPPKVVLLGDDPTFPEVAGEFPEHVSVDARVDYNFNGIPQFHSIVARAQAADTDLSMIINGDIILLNDLLPAVQKVNAYFDNWVLTAARWDLGTEFPFSYEPKDREASGKSLATMEQEIREFVRKSGSLHTYGGVDFWLWNNSPVPLFAGAMPPFTFGRSKYDNWLTHEAIAAGLRHVVDASDALTNLHVAHAYQHVASLMNGTESSVANGKNFWSMRKQSSWEMFNNIHLAESHGSYTNQKGTALHCPWRLATCHEPAAGNICMLKRARPANCSCEYSAYLPTTQSDPKLDKTGHWVCGMVSVDRRKDYEIVASVGPHAKEGLPHTMAQLLPVRAREVEDLKVVTLVAVTFGYAEMLLNFVCRLRLLGLDGNLVIAALDEELYKFAFNQGLAVYYEQASDGLKKVDSADCAFGTQCFRQFTKLKSRAVLRVLEAGYSVLWTDVDIVWYSDPLPHLAAFGPGTFPIQSNEPNASIPGTGIRRINSGFYFARSDVQTIQAFRAITAHAAKTKLSEQPSFYDVLCGEKGELLVPRKEECKWTNGLRTIFLDRARYPNGAVHGFWDKKDVTAACRQRKCTILHNNWISGKDAKKERLVQNGYWHYDVERRMCMHDWHSRLHPVLKADDVRRPPATATDEAAAHEER